MIDQDIEQYNIEKLFSSKIIEQDLSKGPKIVSKIIFCEGSYLLAKAESFLDSSDRFSIRLSALERESQHQ